MLSRAEPIQTCQTFIMLTSHKLSDEICGLGIDGIVKSLFQFQSAKGDVKETEE